MHGESGAPIALHAALFDPYTHIFALKQFGSKLSHAFIQQENSD
jgi:hypothetical protein